jgi:hypothetical protein
MIVCRWKFALMTSQKFAVSGKLYGGITLSFVASVMPSIF